MKTPTHWHNKGAMSYLLQPFGLLYASVTALRLYLKKPQKVAYPVICVGNLTAGGTGKTPVSISIANLLKDNGFKPYFISRGYGGKLKGVIVNSLHSAEEVGDEPLLLAQTAKVSINPNRYLAAKSAIADGADVLVMDDGFQNPTLHKDISFLVFDGTSGIGNGFNVPAGPLREFFCLGIKRADAVVIIGKDVHDIAKTVKDKPIFFATVEACQKAQNNQKVVAFAGIGKPEKFYNSLKNQGFNLCQTIDFPDHHSYTEDELLDILQQAQNADATVWTTAKDWVKIPENLKDKFKVLDITIQWQDEEILRNFVLSSI